MKQLTAVLLAGLLLACGDDSDASPPPTVGPEEERPGIVGDDAIGYLLDNGLVLWVEPPIGRIVAGNGDCDDLVGPPDVFYDKYNDETIPGFEGLVCNREGL